MHDRGLCIARGHAWQGKWQLQRAVRILLECILVIMQFWNFFCQIIGWSPAYGVVAPVWDILDLPLELHICIKMGMLYHTLGLKQNKDSMNWKFNYLVISLFTDCPLESIPRDSVKSSSLLLDSRELHYSHLKLNSVTQTK